MDNQLKERIKKLRTKVRTNLLRKVGEMDKLFDPAQTYAEVTKALIDERRSIVLQLLGIHWNDYENRAEVRNTRNGVAAFMEQHCKAAVDQWMRDEIFPLIQARGKDSLLQQNMKAGLLQHFDREFRRKLEYHCSEVADRLAQEAAAAFAQDMKNIILEESKNDEEHPADVQ